MWEVLIINPKENKKVNKMIKIYISPIMGMEKERETAVNAIEDLIQNPHQYEIYQSEPSDSIETRLEKVEECDIFIPILKDKISGTVLEEFEKAVETEKDILPFVKRHKNNKKLKESLQDIEDDFSYKKFSSLEQLGKYVIQGIQNLLIDSYASKETDTEETETEILTDETIIVEPFESQMFEYELEKGDVIEGVVKEVNEESFNVYLMDEDSYNDFQDGKEFSYIGGEEDVYELSFDEEIEEDGTYYLVFDTNARVKDREIEVRIERVRYL